MGYAFPKKAQSRLKHYIPGTKQSDSSSKLTYIYIYIYSNSEVCRSSWWSNYRKTYFETLVFYHLDYWLMRIYIYIYI